MVQIECYVFPLLPERHGAPLPSWCCDRPYVALFVRYAKCFNNLQFGQAVDGGAAEMGWFGTGKSRSKFGKWVDERGMTQRELSDRSGVNRNTIGELANNEDTKPSWKTRRKLDRSLRDTGFNSDDFWGPVM